MRYSVFICGRLKERGTMIYDSIQNDFMCFVLCILFFIYVIFDRSFENRIKMYFLGAIMVILCLLAVDNLELYEAQSDYPTLARKLYIAIGYTLRPCIGMAMTGALVRSNRERETIKRVALYSIFGILNALICMASVGTGWVFYLDSTNLFVRGPVWFFPFFTGLWYLFVIGWISLKHFRMKRKGEAAVICMLAILSVLGTLMESIWGFVGTLTDVTSIVVVLYYLFLHVNMFSRDELTNAYTRRIFFMDVKNPKRKDVVIVAMDLNNLKEINDNKGHKYGDNALIEYAKTVRKYKKKNCVLYRMGGDEFSMICKDMTEEQVVETMKKIEKELNEKSYSFAYGVVTYHGGDDITEVNHLVDQRMYRMKRTMKEEKCK